MARQTAAASPIRERRGQSFTVTSYGNANWLFTARPRVGFVAANPGLYGTGGLALTRLQSDFSFVDSVPGDNSVAASTNPANSTPSKWATPSVAA